MNYKAAKSLAERNANKFALNAKAQCRSADTGLIVLVYRADDKEAIDSAEVFASDTKAVTTAEGLGKFLPLAPKKHSVRVGKLVDPDRLYHAPAAVEMDIAKGTCPVHPIRISIWGRPSLELVWKHDDSKVQGAAISVDRGKYDFGATGADGIATWEGVDAIQPGDYRCYVKVDGADCQLFSADGLNEIKPTRLVVPLGKKKLTFKVRRPSWVKLSVVKDKGAESVEGADFKITWPEDRSIKSFKTAKAADKVFADVKDIAVIAMPLTCDIVSLEIADGETYEVIDVESA